MNLASEAREALRGLWRHPGFLLRATLTLATGVAASTLLFSLVAGTLLTPPALPAPERLLMLHMDGAVEGNLGGPDVADLRASVPEFSAVGLVWDGYAFDTVFDDRAARIDGAVVDKGYFDALDATPVLGRFFAPEEDGPAAPRVAIVSERLWRSRFGADPAILGRTLTLNGLPFEVIGVAPDAADVLHLGHDLWAPAAIAGDWVYTARGSGVFDAIARLAPGATREGANSTLAGVMARLAQAHPRSNAGRTLQGTPVQSFANAPARELLWVLQAATLVLLAVGVANVMSLLLVRGVARRQEYAMRSALGAGRGRLARVTLMEGALVGLAGALLGGALAWLALDAVLAFSRSALPAHARAAVDLRVLGFAAAVAIGAGMLAALGPALRLARAPAANARSTGSRSLRQVLDGLMASEIALACALAIGALVLLRSLAGLAAVPLGFQPDGVLGAELVLPDSRYGTVESQSRAVERAVAELAREPGVRDAAFVVGPPLRPDCCIGHNVVIEGQVHGDDTPGARVRPVLGDYFGALGIPLAEGRAFAATDDRDAPRVAIVNRRFAERHFAGRSAVGQRIAWRPGDVTPEAAGPQWMTIVGVVEDVKSGSLREEDSAAVYFPYLQRDQEWIRFGTLLARTEGDPARHAAAMHAAMARVDPLVPLQELRPLREVAAQAVAPERFAAGLAAAFGVLALALALQGVAAVLGFGVAQRRAELGIRAALGADAAHLRGLLLGQGARAAVAGIALGVALALLGSRALDALVFGVSARDGGSYALVAFSLLAFALFAAWWPARRAARVAPADALRHD